MLLYYKRSIRCLGQLFMNNYDLDLVNNFLIPIQFSPYYNIFV